MFDLKIGFKCNNNCVHCVVADKRQAGSLSLLRIIMIINSIPQGEEIQITGGEPSIYGNFFIEILKACKARNLKVVLQTNATGFADKAFAQKCAPFIFHAHVAIHSSNPEIHNRIVQDTTGTMWQKTIDGYRNLKKFGVPCMTTQTVVTKLNMPTIYKTFSWIQTELDPGVHMSLTYPHLMGNAYDNRNEICFRYSEFKNEIQQVLKDFRSVMFTESIPFCYLHPYVEEVESIEKDLIIFRPSRVGIDFSDGFELKNYEESDLKGRAKIPSCSSCLYNKICPGVWKEYIYLFKDRIDLFPIKEE